jgi:transcriptional regulator with XRE-family HTH domain
MEQTLREYNANGMTEQSFLEQEREIDSLISSLGPGIIGARVKRERLAQGVSIRDLAARSQLGKSSIVRLEAGQEFRSITLLKICTALGLHLERLGSAAGNDAVALHRRGDDRWVEMEGFGDSTLGGEDGPLTYDKRRRLVEEGAKNPLVLLRSRLGQGKLLPTLIEICEPSSTRSHPGEEFVFVLSGSVEVKVSGVGYRLDKGESIDFWGSEPHSYAPVSDAPALLLSLRVNP